MTRARRHLYRTLGRYVAVLVYTDLRARGWGARDALCAARNSF